MRLGGYEAERKEPTEDNWRPRTAPVTRKSKAGLHFHPSFAMGLRPLPLVEYESHASKDCAEGCNRGCNSGTAFSFSELAVKVSLLQVLLHLVELLLCDFALSIPLLEDTHCAALLPVTAAPSPSPAPEEPPRHEKNEQNPEERKDPEEGEERIGSCDDGWMPRRSWLR